jgi:mannitol/fructose-specific phosphotransferase system IIA component (Ntr-type)
LNKTGILTESIVCTAILDVDASATKTTVIERLLHELAAAGHVSAADVPSLLQAVLRREEAATTAIGNGVALPHGKHPAVPRPVGVLGLCRPAVNFASIDGRPTDIIVLLLAPPSRPGVDERRSSHFAGALLRLLRDERFRGSVRQARSAHDLAALLAGQG